MVKVADSVAVIAVPGLGDAVQTLKAGILEVADLFVVNMADRPGAERTAAELLAMLQLGGDDADAWVPPIVETVAVEERAANGVERLWDELGRHRAHLGRAASLTGGGGGASRQRCWSWSTGQLRARLRADVAGGVPRHARLLDRQARLRAMLPDPHHARRRRSWMPASPTRSAPGMGMLKEVGDADPAVSGNTSRRSRQDVEVDAEGFVDRQGRRLAGVRVGPRTVVRADQAPIAVGAHVRLGRGATVHVDPGFPTPIGADVVVEDDAIVHGCTLGDGGAGRADATVLTGSTVGEGSIVQAGALVPEGKRYPPGR